MAAAIAPAPVPAQGLVTLATLVTAVKGLLASFDAPPTSLLPTPSELPLAVVEEPPFSAMRSYSPAIQADRPRTAPLMEPGGPGSVMAVCALSGRRYHVGCLTSHEVLQVMVSTHQL